MAEALVTPQVIEWARQRYHLAIDTAAEKLKIKPGKLEAWEKGDERPTFRQAQRLAQKLRIPFGYLFLSAPPEEKLPLPDLRIVAGTQPHPSSPDFSDLLNDVLRKQQWYREYQESEGAQPVPFIGSFTLSSSPEIIAVDIVEPQNKHHHRTDKQTPKKKWNSPSCAWWCKGESTNEVTGTKEQMFEMCAHNCKKV